MVPSVRSYGRCGGGGGGGVGGSRFTTSWILVLFLMSSLFETQNLHHHGVAAEAVTSSSSATSSSSSATSSSSSSPPSVYPVKEYIFDAVIDHFNFWPTSVPTFPLRYYVNTDYWVKNWKNDDDNDTNNDNEEQQQTNSGPCLFYAGNEADIFQFVNNSGFMFEVARELNAMVVFAEHRYYGLSNPFSNEYALQGKNVSYLTVEQAMADFNTLTIHIRKQFDMDKSSAFIAFGGSYGANLALWLRLKNPNIWAGAIASSATPLKHLLRSTNGFTRIETEAYGNVSSTCPDLVRQGWKDLFTMSDTENGRAWISKELNLCDTMPDENAAWDIHGWISGALETMVQYGYPYETSFYNPVPAYPFKVTCERMVSVASNSGLGALRTAAEIYYNYTGQMNSHCFDFFSHVIIETAKYWHRTGQKDRLYGVHTRMMTRKEQKKKGQNKMIVQEQKEALTQQKQLQKENLRRSKTILTGKEDEEHRDDSQDEIPGYSNVHVEGRTLIHTNEGDDTEDDDENKNNDDQDIRDDGDDDDDGEFRYYLEWEETNDAWGYQTCTEVYQPMPTDGITDFDIPYVPDKEQYFEYCQQRWNVMPRPDWEEMVFMSDNIGSGTNIFLSNGQLDPWRAAGIQVQPKGSDANSIIVRTIEHGAHHLDLRASHPLDPVSVIECRKEEKEAMVKWIQEWKELHTTI